MNLYKEYPIPIKHNKCNYSRNNKNSSFLYKKKFF